jgi:hypothetical protein
MRKVRQRWHRAISGHTFATGKPGLGVADAREGELPSARTTTGLPSGQHSFDGRFLAEPVTNRNRLAGPRMLTACQLLLGHRKLESTIRHLGIEVDDALEMSEQIDL